MLHYNTFLQHLRVIGCAKLSNTFPKFHMMLDASGDSSDDTRGFDLQQAFVHFFNTASTVPFLPTML